MQLVILARKYIKNECIDAVLWHGKIIGHTRANVITAMVILGA